MLYARLKTLDDPKGSSVFNEDTFLSSFEDKTHPFHSI